MVSNSLYRFLIVRKHVDEKIYFMSDLIAKYSMNVDDMQSNRK